MIFISSGVPEQFDPDGLGARETRLQKCSVPRPVLAYVVMPSVVLTPSFSESITTNQLILHGYHKPQFSSSDRYSQSTFPGTSCMQQSDIVRFQPASLLSLLDWSTGLVSLVTLQTPTTPTPHHHKEQPWGQGEHHNE